jgi:hypothetical protein
VQLEKRDSALRQRRNNVRELSRRRAFWSRPGEQKNSVDLLALLLGRVLTQKCVNQ